MTEQRGMGPDKYDQEARAIARQLLPGPRVAIIGSASFWGHDSKSICADVGEQLAAIEDLILITGGVSGVGEAVGRSFFEARRGESAPTATYHILPRGSKAWDYGETLFAGSNMGERREVLGRLAEVYVAIEGGPGTEHEAAVARRTGAVVVPVGRTGGFSAELFPKINCPSASVEKEWQLLNDETASTRRAGTGVRCIVEQLIRRSER